MLEGNPQFPYSLLRYLVTPGGPVAALSLRLPNVLGALLRDLTASRHGK